MGQTGTGGSRSISEDKRPDVSIIIVSYNTKVKTLKCIESVLCFTEGIDYEIIVSENGSSDGSLEEIRKRYPAVMVLDNQSNLGFGRANNRALARARGKYVLYLNSDAYFTNNAAKMMYDYWEHSKEKNTLGALGSFLRNPQGDLIHSGGEFPTYGQFCMGQAKANVIYCLKSIVKVFHLEKIYKKEGCRRKYRESLQKREKEFEEVGYITGADLFLRNDENAKFNEAYFMYYEETELELNLKRQGLRRILMKGPGIVHDQDNERDFCVYRMTDCFWELSAMEYAAANLTAKTYLLRFLYCCANILPYVRKIRKKAAECIARAGEEQ